MAGSLSRSESATGITAFGAAPGYGYEPPIYSHPQPGGSIGSGSRFGGTSTTTSFGSAGYASRSVSAGGSGTSGASGTSGTGSRSIYFANIAQGCLEQDLYLDNNKLNHDHEGLTLKLDLSR